MMEVSYIYQECLQNVWHRPLYVSYLPIQVLKTSSQEPAYAFENSVAKRKMPKITRFQHLYNDPLSSLGKPEDFGNNNAKIRVKEEFNIKQEWANIFIEIYSMYVWFILPI